MVLLYKSSYRCPDSPDYRPHPQTTEPGNYWHLNPTEIPTAGSSRKFMLPSLYRVSPPSSTMGRINIPLERWANCRIASDFRSTTDCLYRCPVLEARNCNGPSSHYQAAEYSIWFLLFSLSRRFNGSDDLLFTGLVPSDKGRQRY
jgi:hypothetical protein